MNTQIVQRLTEHFERIDRADHIRAAVLTGRGKAFVAGADIGEYSEQSFTEFSEYQARGRRMYEGIEFNRKPFIAAVNEIGRASWRDREWARVDAVHGAGAR